MNIRLNINKYYETNGDGIEGEYEGDCKEYEYVGDEDSDGIEGEYVGEWDGDDFILLLQRLLISD